MAKKTDDSRTTFNPSGMNVQIKTKQMLEEWHDDAKISWGTLMDRVAIHLTRGSGKPFNSRTATDDWEGEEQG